MSQQDSTASPPPANRSKRRRIVWILFLVGTAVLGVTIWGLLGSRFRDNSKTLVYYRVRRANLPITVTERGNLESQQEVDVVCEVENLGGDRSGNSGTQILMIVPNGTQVKKGDLLVELDAAPLTDRLDGQLLALEKARAEKIQANVKYENQKTQNQTALDEAKLKVQLAKLDLENYEDEEGGTFQISLQEKELAIQEAQSQQVINDSELRGVEMLYKLGYKSKSELASARLTKMRSDRMLAKSVSERKEMVKYQYRKKKLELGGAVNSAQRSLLQVERDNTSLLAQAKAAKDAADRSLVKEEERYNRYTSQLEKCKIYAPADGMVTYAPPSRYSRAVHEGAFVRQRQKIMSLPSLTTMQVTTAVHESVLDQVRPGLPATVRMEPFPDRRYRGSVKSVAVLPDRGSWMNSDTKVYRTLVTIDEEVSQLKPGMTAIVEIHVDRLKDVLAVPVQAIVQIGGDNWVYIDRGGRVSRQTVKLGRTNDKFVEIKEGITEDDQVVLNPMSIVDDARDEKKDISPEKDGNATPKDFDFEAEKARAKKNQAANGKRGKGGYRGKNSRGKDKWGSSKGRSQKGRSSKGRSSQRRPSRKSPGGSAKGRSTKGRSTKDRSSRKLPQSTS